MDHTPWHIHENLRTGRLATIADENHAMAPAQLNPALPRLSPAGPDLIEAVVDNMRKNLEPLKYSTLAPSRFTVYVHPTNTRGSRESFRSSRNRPSGRWPMSSETQPPLAGQAVARAAQQRIPARDRQRRRRMAGRVPGRPRRRHADGDLLIDSELVLPARPELGVGERTRRITTIHTGHRTTTREHTVNRAPQATARDRSSRA